TIQRLYTVVGGRAYRRIVMECLPCDAVLRRQVDCSLVWVGCVSTRIAESMSALISYVGDGHGKRRGERLLQSNIPGIERGKEKRVGACPGVDCVTRIR